MHFSLAFSVNQHTRGKLSPAWSWELFPGIEHIWKQICASYLCQSEIVFCPKCFCGIWSKIVILLLKWTLWLCLPGSLRLRDVYRCLWVRFHCANWNILSTASCDDRIFISGWASTNISEILNAGKKRFSNFLTSWPLGQALTCLAYSCAWCISSNPNHSMI